MDKIQERLKASIERQDGIEKALEDLGQAVKQAVGNHKTWNDSEVQRCYRIIASLTSERDLAVEQLLKAKRIINQVKQDLG
jgi:hypothetical protein